MPSIAHCLRQQLTALGQDPLQLQALSKAVHSLLPPKLAAQCQVSHFSKGCLLLTTDQPTWASQLRYLIPELRDKLRKEAGMHQHSSIKIMVRDDPSVYKKASPKASFTLSEQTKATIISESQLCTYQPLKKALLHLALGKEV